MFPEIEPYHTFMFPVSDLHTLYVEECGNPDGAPILFLHGGPGGGLSPQARRYFDPTFYRIILFDQRGAGKSTPTACLIDNSTEHLIADIEKLRKFLGIDQWVVFGGSWGTTLALSYAIKHSSNCLGLILRGIFLGRKEDIDWLYQSGSSAFFPEIWKSYEEYIPLEERDDYISAYYKRLVSDDPAVRLEAAKHWASWENQIVYLIPKPLEEWTPERETAALNLARMECHYFYHQMFQEDDLYLLHQAHHLANIPMTIVHGRYDIDCRPIGAYLLHERLPHSQLIFVKDAGHSGYEPGMITALVEATETFKVLYSPK